MEFSIEIYIYSRLNILITIKKRGFDNLTQSRIFLHKIHLRLKGPKKREMKNKIRKTKWNNTHRPDEPLDRLSLILFKYSDGLIKWLLPSDDPLGKLGGTNGNTNCLFTKFGPVGRELLLLFRSNCENVWYSSDDTTDDALPDGWWCCADDVPLMSLAFLLAETIRGTSNKWLHWNAM